MTSSELAALFAMSEPTVRKLQRQGVIAKEGRTFPVVETIRSYVTHLRRLAAAHKSRPRRSRPNYPKATTEFSGSSK